MQTEVQLELPFMKPPPKPRTDMPIRASPRRVACRFCGGVHDSQAEVLVCKEGR